ncbi:lactadherin-like [Amphiura filiformis]|uniref:lactadherin-like n=1 Tax=Amphiura filiformis TaxID=82378 RepID=UPI003B222A68
MESGDIRDGNIQASSEQSSGDAAYPATKGRLNGPSAWYAVKSQTGPIWIQADIGYPSYVSGMKTQGDETSFDCWVTSFKVSTFPTTGGNEVFVEDQNGIAITFSGNVDPSSELTTMFTGKVYARIVRITCLTTSCNGWYTLRFEILGCTAYT